MGNLCNCCQIGLAKHTGITCVAIIEEFVMHSDLEIELEITENELI